MGKFDEIQLGEDIKNDGTSYGKMEKLYRV